MIWLNLASSRRAAAGRPSGVTLLELLLAVALTLIIILAIVRVFDLLGGNVNQSRSILELSAQLRTTATQLQTDLDRLTLKPIPPANPLTAPGYFEIIEGKRSDRDNDGDDVMDTDPADMVFDLIVPNSPAFAGGVPLTPNLAAELRGVLGDVDDLWMGTIRSAEEPFRGRVFVPQTNTHMIIESPLAEVVWWMEPIVGPGGIAAGATELVLVRRVLLILPTPQIQQILGSVPLTSPAELQQFLARNDLSVRPELVDNGSGSLVPRIVPNSLADLSIRRNRFAHWADNPLALVPPQATFPDPLNRYYLVRASDLSDLVLNDVLALDLRVYDPLAPVFRPSPSSAYVLTPIDPGFGTFAKPIDPQNPGTFPESYGAFVDLGFNLNLKQPGGLWTPIVSQFSGPPHSRSRLWAPALANAPRVFCTWSTLYERDNVDQNQNNAVDEGTDGFDTQVPIPPEYVRTPYVPAFVVDDMFEHETSPPYTYPLSGLEVVLRVRDLSTQQVRQTSVVREFAVP